MSQRRRQRRGEKEVAIVRGGEWGQGGQLYWRAHTSSPREYLGFKKGLRNRNPKKKPKKKTTKDNGRTRSWLFRISGR